MPLAYMPAQFPHGYQYGETALYTKLDKCPVDKQRHLSFPFYVKEWRYEDLWHLRRVLARGPPLV